MGREEGQAGGEDAPLPTLPSRDELKALAAEPDPAAPAFTRAGRSLQKHGYRAGGSVFPKVAGPPATYNSVAAQLVRRIIDDPATVISMRSKARRRQVLPYVDVIAPDVRQLGYFWDAVRGRFVLDGLREPPLRRPRPEASDASRTEDVTP